MIYKPSIASSFPRLPGSHPLPLQRRQSDRPLQSSWSDVPGETWFSSDINVYYIMIYNGYILLLDHVMFWCLNIFSSRPGLREMDLARRKLGTTMATLQHHFTTLSLETWMNLGWKRIEPAWTLDEHWITKYEHCMNNDHGWQLDKHGGTWTGGQTKITWVWVKIPVIIPKNE